MMSDLESSRMVRLLAHKCRADGVSVSDKRGGGGTVPYIVLCLCDTGRRGREGTMQ